MNEKIKELAEQCGFKSNPDIYDRNQSFDIPKFAELIVQECVGVADDYVKDCLCEEHINCKHPRSAIGRKIQEHFGVEE